jgi:hypothetical protein
MFNTRVFSPESDSPNFFNSMAIFYPVITFVFLFGYMGWFWAMAIGLKNKVPDTLKMKTGKFKFFFLFVIIYLLVFSIYFVRLFMSFDFEPLVFAIIFPMHIFDMFCLFYCIYFASKTIKIIELNREVTFVDYAGEFFLIWFFPIGLWFIQPKINKMIE